MKFMADKITILACQIEVPNFSDAKSRDAHNKRVAGLIDTKLSKKHCDLVVMPELSSLDYSIDAFENLTELAESTTGSSFTIFSSLAKKHKSTLVYGIARRGENGAYISQIIVGPDGKLDGYYDKIHLAKIKNSHENIFFKDGNKTLCINIRGFKISPIICYDIRFPELSRKLAIKDGVEVILHCGAYKKDPTFYSWHSFAITRALENQVYFLSLNRAGKDFGHSIFCEPWVDEETPPFKFNSSEQLEIFELRKDRVNNAREKITFLKDRKPNLY